ncbi:uncharacterized protein [Miscanthus floridulus]|uniref:uncharacterized protein isoform X2 n=1 Tax=Miscanthus floridulus TaxID=154761 RepID=UPI00345B27CA
MLLLFETPSGFALFTFLRGHCYLPDSVNDIWAKFADYLRSLWYDDVDVEKMKKYVQELELKNTELKQKLEAAQAQLKEGNKYIDCDPLIDEELRKCHDVFLCPHESDYKKNFQNFSVILSQNSL